jgi:hypothetical protein
MLLKALHLNTNILGKTQGEGIAEIRGPRLGNTITLIHVILIFMFGTNYFNIKIVKNK